MLFEKFDKSLKDIVFVYTICGSLDEARDIGYSAIGEKLAISMDCWPIHSVYPWQNVMQEVDQFMLMFGTQKALSEKLVKHIESEHSYKIPMVVVCNTSMANLPYSLWVENTLSEETKFVSDDGVHNKSDVNSLNKLK